MDKLIQTPEPDASTAAANTLGQIDLGAINPGDGIHADVMQPPQLDGRLPAQEHQPGRIMKVARNIFPMIRLAERPVDVPEVLEHAQRERRRATERLGSVAGMDSTDRSYALGFLPRPY